MTPAEATEFAVSIRARIAFNEKHWPDDLPPNPHHAADRERVDRDLHVFRVVHGVYVHDHAEANVALDVAQAAAADGLILTGSLYGVEP